MSFRHVALTMALCTAPLGWCASPELRPTGEYSRRIWRAQDGLPQSRIQAISQTADGYLWVGTLSGLARFDGLRFSVFERNNTPAFQDDSILSLCPSKDGGLWVGTDGGGLLHYRNGSFQSYGTKEGLSNGFIRALHEDHHGTLWIGSHRGFFRMRNGKIERLDNQGAIPIISVLSINEDENQRVWVANTSGLLVVENDVVRRIQVDGKPPRGARGIYRGREGGVGFWTDSGLADMKSSGLVSPPVTAGIRATAVGQDHEGNLWIGTEGEGLRRLNADGLTHYRAPNALPDDTVLSIFEDNGQNLWIGTHDGLLRMSKTSIRTLSRKDGLSNDNVLNTWEDREGTLWLTTITGKVYRYGSGKLTAVVLPPPYSQISAKLVFKDKNNDLWIGTWDTGLLRLSQGKVTTFTTKDGIRNNQIRQFWEDRRGELWIGLGSGLSRWDGKQFHNYYLEDGLAYGSVRSLSEDHNGDMLVGTERGLNRVHDGKIVPDELFAKLNGERIWATHEDASHGLWVGTRGNGLFWLKTGKVGKVTVRDGLLSNSIYRILEDGNGNLWMSSPAGVFSASRAELNRVADGGPGPIAVLPAGVANGIESTQMNGGVGSAGCKGRDGKLWFPGVIGAVQIDPNERSVSASSPVVIESILADDTPIGVKDGLRIPAGHGRIQIGYTASSLLSPERISYKYKLEGLDENWTAAPNQHAAYYTNLPPGNYRFRVIATDSATPFSPTEAGVSFFWEPHFYQTNWFYSLCAALAGLSIWGVLGFYTQQTKARYAVLLAERTRLAREMHDTVIQGCVGVSTLLEAASGFQEIDTDRMSQLVDQARVQVRLTLDEAREAVWNLRHAWLDGDIAGILGDFARQLSSEKGVPIDVDVAGAPPVLQEGTMRSILLVAREAIRNAANHGSPKRINIRMSFESDEARLEVIDDGIGFVPATELASSNGHYGIMGMQERVQEMGGEFQLRSSVGHGTAVIVTLPLDQNQE